MKPWEQNFNAVSDGVPWETNSFNKTTYAPMNPAEGETSEKLLLEQSGETVDAPLGSANFFATVQNDDVFDAPSTVFKESNAAMEKQAAYIAFVANAYGLIADDEIHEFIASRSRALASAQRRQPEYAKQFSSEWENADGFFEGMAAIVGNPRGLGRQVITQSANSMIPILTTFGGAVAGTAVAGPFGGVAGGAAGSLVGGSIVEIGAVIDQLAQEAGYDTSDPNQVLALLQNDQLMAGIRTQAERKGITTAAVDSLFQVVGGRFLRAASKTGATGVKKTAVGAVDVAIQSAGEGIGEAAGQLAGFGKIDVKDAILESITGLGQSVAQTAIGASVGTSGNVAGVALKKAKQVINRTDNATIQSEADIKAAFAKMDALEQQVSSKTAEQLLAQDAQSDTNTQQPTRRDPVNYAGYDVVAANTKDFDKTVFNIVTKDKKVGEIKVKINPENKTLRILNVDVKEDSRRSGAAYNAHKQVIDSALDNGYVVESDTIISADAKGLYRKLAQDYKSTKNRQIPYRDGGVTSINAAERTKASNARHTELTALGRDGGIVSVDNLGGKPLFTFTGNKIAVKKSDSKTVPFTQLKGLDASFVKSVSQVKTDSSGFMSGLVASTGDAIGAVSTGFGKALVPISTQIRNVSLKLAFRLRKYEFEVKTQTMSDNATINPFLKKFANLDGDTQTALDYAMKNSDVKAVKVIAEANNMVAEVQAVRDLLDDLYTRAKAVQVDVEYRAFFFPRRVRDMEGLMSAIHKTETWTVLQAAVAAKESKTGKKVTDEERVQIIDSLLRGHKVENISLAKKGIHKDRSIEQLPPELSKYYDTSNKALLTYIGVANDSIATSRLFGRGIDIHGNTDNGDSIGTLVSELAAKQDITPKQARIVSEALNARFNEGRTGAFLFGVRDLIYVDVMGSPLNAITQFGDLATSIYNAGIVNSFTTLPMAVMNKGELNLTDIGMDKIAQEFDNGAMTSKMVEKTFALTGLTKIDKIGKLTLVNSTLKKYRAMAKKKKLNQDFVQQLEAMFEEDAGQVLQDLKNGVMSEDIKFLAFNTLLDFQPVAKSEMPQYYLTSGNMKLAYVLKSFTIKQIDAYRREGTSKIYDGVRTKNPKLVLQGITNFARLYSLYVVMGASADFMKDMLRSAFGGDEMEEPEAYVLDNMWKAIGFSRYQKDMLHRDGLSQSAFDLVIPPTKFIDNLEKDIKKFQKDGLTITNARSIRSVPLGGELYYFWFDEYDESTYNGNKVSFR